MMWRSRRPGSRDEALLVALGKRLRGVAGSVHPRPDFRSSLRTSLVMEAATALVPAPGQPSVPAARFTRAIPRRRMVMATALVAASLGLGSMASASASALPGEALYPVKRATEQVEVAFHRDPADRGAFQLELAERRLDEARALVKRGPEFADLAAESVREFEESATAGTANLMTAYREDNARIAIVVLNRFTERTDEALDALASQLPAEAMVALEDARDQLEAIDSSSGELCPTCGGGLDASPSSPDRSDGSAEPAPDPEPEPEPPPSAPPPVEPSISVPSDTSTSTSEDEDDDDDSDSDDDGDEEDEADEPDVPTPTPTPTLTPEPTPTPDPTPSPTPTPDPTEPPQPPAPPGLPDIIPETLEGVGNGVGQLIGGTLGGLHLGQDAD